MFFCSLGAKIGIQVKALTLFFPLGSFPTIILVEGHFSLQTFLNWIGVKKEVRVGSVKALFLFLRRRSARSYPSFSYLLCSLHFL